jgi:hypothetical protein
VRAHSNFNLVPGSEFQFHKILNDAVCYVALWMYSVREHSRGSNLAVNVGDGTVGSGHIRSLRSVTINLCLCPNGIPDSKSAKATLFSFFFGYGLVCPYKFTQAK